jgi:hypothetical protein
MKIPTWLYLVGAYFLLRPKGGESASTDIPPKPRYFARLVLHGTESLASAGDVQKKFQGLGFSDVHVWMDDPPRSWPSPGAKGPFVLGTWSGPATEVTLPAEVVECWVEQ